MAPLPELSYSSAITRLKWNVAFILQHMFSANTS